MQPSPKFSEQLVKNQKFYVINKYNTIFIFNRKEGLAQFDQKIKGVHK